MKLYVKTRFFFLQKVKSNNRKQKTKNQEWRWQLGWRIWLKLHAFGASLLFCCTLEISLYLNIWHYLEHSLQITGLNIIRLVLNQSLFPSFSFSFLCFTFLILHPPYYIFHGYLIFQVYDLSSPVDHYLLESRKRILSQRGRKSKSKQIKSVLHL